MLKIRRALVSDATAIADIYNWYIRNTTASFESASVSVPEMRRRILDKLSHYDWLIAESDRKVAGYAYYGSFRPRAAYYRTVETSIYLAQGSVGRGWGTELYAALIESAAKKQYLQMVAVIALPNPACLALHERLGFEQAGILRGVGFKFGAFHDIALWQRATTA
jgi:L-amino acid N-acyltransferase YncA